MRSYIFVILAALSAAAASAQSVPPAIFTDPPADAAHPAQMTVLHIPTHGVQINGIVYQPSGAGPHPTLVICHGLPGNEKNLDLAQAVRRAGWNAVTFNYRGSWGSPGVFRFSQALEDAGAVLAYLRDPANVKRLGIDTRRIVIAGHSMGGWVVVHTASRDHGLIGAIIISAADMGKAGDMPRDRLVADMADNMESLAGVTPESMAEEVRALGKTFRFENAAAGLTQTPLLALTADDGLAPDTDALVRLIQAQGGHEVTPMHVATDHSWSDHRIALESTILIWLAGLQSPQNAQQPHTAATTQPATLKKALTKTVGLLTALYVKDGVPMQSRGTCFFVFYPDERMGKGQGFLYLVTNRHVVVPGIDQGHLYNVTATTLRANRKDSGRFEEGPLPVSSQFHWYFPADDAVDLAVFTATTQSANLDIAPIPVSMFATRDEVEKNNIGEGDSVFFAGFSDQFPGPQRFEPMVREGVLDIPDEPLRTTLHKPENLYLADMRATNGNSGSPVFVDLSGFGNGAVIAGNPYKLLGIISGNYFENSDLTSTIATTHQATANQDKDSGVAMIVPVDALKDLLDSPPLQSLRDAEVARKKAG